MYPQKIIEKFWSRVDKQGANDCWEWMGNLWNNGYGRFCFSVNGNLTTIGAHRFSYEINSGEPISKGLFVYHQCDNPKCVNPSHLFLGTNSDNLLDASKKGRTATGKRNGQHTHPERSIRGDAHWTRIHPEKKLRGVSNGRAKLTEKEIIEMRFLYSTGKFSYEKLAKKYSITSVQVGNIIRKESWTHVI